jgi:hypothetical protein
MVVHENVCPQGKVVRLSRRLDRLRKPKTGAFRLKERVFVIKTERQLMGMPWDVERPSPWTVIPLKTHLELTF